jgi:UDP-N-acetylmuramate dehydrogenase
VTLPAWLPPLSGKATENAPLAPLTTIKVGGPADLLVEAAGWDDVAALLKAKPADLPLTLLGLGSNMVIRQGGIRGVVLHLATGCDDVSVEGETLYAEAGASCGKAARAAREAGMGGLAFFGGIPGSIGGALFMNAGAYGSETYDRLQKLYVLNPRGEVEEHGKDFVSPRYRHTSLPQGYIYKAATWLLSAQDKEEIREAMRTVNHARSSTQPLHLPSSGSWFKNVLATPENLPLLQKINPEIQPGQTCNAWKIVDAAGCRGMSHNGAQVSEQHCNFFVNAGAKHGAPATADDLDILSHRVEAQIQEKLGITMEREVKFYGQP